MIIKKALHEIADRQCGYFTARQAASAGYKQYNHCYHVSNGNWLKMERGLFRLPGYEDTPESAFVRWSFWVIGRSPSRRVTVSHESALFHYGLSDEPPAEVHLTVPSAQLNKEEQPGCVFHRQELEWDEASAHPGYRITTPARTLTDMKPELLLAGRWLATVRLALDKELIRKDVARDLLGEVFYDTQSAGRDYGNTAQEERARKRGGICALANQRDRRSAAALAEGGDKAMSEAYAGLRTGIPGRREWLAPNRSFTLIEMLVVIAIICILSALLVPSLNSAMSAARLTGCLNNLKGVAAGLQGYTDSYNNYFPARGGTNGPQWATVIEPFCNSLPKWPLTGVKARPAGVWACPASQKVIFWWMADYTNNPATGTSPTAGGGLDYPLTNWVKAQKAINPSKTFIWVDSAATNEYTAFDAQAYYTFAEAPGGTGPRHEKKAAILYVDSHAESIDPYDPYEFPNGANAALRGLAAWQCGNYYPWILK